MTTDLLLAKSALWDAIAQNKRVAVLCSTERDARAVFETVREMIPDGFPASVRSYSGSRSISFPEGAAISFRSTRVGLRGMAVDQLYIPAAVQRDIYEDAKIALATSRVGGLTEY